MGQSKVCFCWLLSRAEFKLNGFSAVLLVFSDSEAVRSKFESSKWGSGDTLPVKSSSEEVSGTDQQCQFFLGLMTKLLQANIVVL